MNQHSLFTARLIRTIDRIPKGDFFADTELPSGSFLEFVKGDSDGRRIYKRQLQSTTVRFKAGDIAPGGRNVVTYFQKSG